MNETNSLRIEIERLIVRAMGKGVKSVPIDALRDALATAQPQPDVKPTASAVNGVEYAFGWLYDNEDTGREFSENHPVESGEVPDATNIIPATHSNLFDELLTTFKAWNQDREELNRLRDRSVGTPDIARMLEALKPFANGVIPDSDTVSGWRFGQHPTPEDFQNAYRVFHGERSRNVNSPRPVVAVQRMGLSDGRTDYFVQIRVEDRSVTPHVFREEFKAAYHVALYNWLLNGGEEPELMEFNERDWPAQRTVIGPSKPSDVAALEGRIGELEDALEEARSLPWPTWATSILATLQSHGYDPVDEMGSVDLGEAFKDYLDGIDDAGGAYERKHQDGEIGEAVARTQTREADDV